MVKKTPMAQGVQGRAIAKETPLFASKDWTYLEGKEPLENHELFAAMQRQVLGEDSELPITARQWMAALAMHRAMQADPANQARPGFKGRSVGSVLQGAATLAANNDDRDLEELLTAMPKEKAQAFAKERFALLMSNADGLADQGLDADAENVREQARILYGQYVSSEEVAKEEVVVQEAIVEDKAIEELVTSGADEGTPEPEAAPETAPEAESAKPKPSQRRRGASS